MNSVKGLRLFLAIFQASLLPNCRPYDKDPHEALYTAVMPINKMSVKLVGVVIALLVSGMSIASCHSRHGVKPETQRASEGKGVRTPLIQGRAATKADFDSGVAVFYIPDGHSAPYSFGHDLPIRAEIAKHGVGDWPIGHRVSVVQAEMTDGQNVTLGVIDGDEQAVCSLDDVRLLQ